MNRLKTFALATAIALSVPVMTGCDDNKTQPTEPESESPLPPRITSKIRLALALAFGNTIPDLNSEKLIKFAELLGFDLNDTSTFSPGNIAVVEQTWERFNACLEAKDDTPEAIEVCQATVGFGTENETPGTGPKKRKSYTLTQALDGYITVHTTEGEDVVVPIKEVTVSAGSIIRDRQEDGTSPGFGILGDEPVATKEEFTCVEVDFTGAIIAGLGKAGAFLIDENPEITRELEFRKAGEPIGNQTCLHKYEYPNGEYKVVLYHRDTDLVVSEQSGDLKREEITIVLTFQHHPDDGDFVELTVVSEDDDDGDDQIEYPIEFSVEPQVTKGAKALFSAIHQYADERLIKFRDIFILN